jgi:DNA topoisomerase-3
VGKKLYITEKPSVAVSFAEALGIKITPSDRKKGFAEQNDSVISWCYGHLVTLAYPEAYDPKYRYWRIEDLPIIPDQYIYEVIKGKGVAKQFKTIEKLMNRKDIDIVYSCTDSGREGEYIFRLVYHRTKCTKPVKRVWINAQTKEAILKGIQEAKDLSEYDSLGNAAYCRAKEDWLFGMNFSRLYTIRYGKKLSQVLNEEKKTVIPIGRVMTCVLGLVVQREREIRNFIPKPYYIVTADFFSEESKISYKGKWQPKKEDKKAENGKDEEEPQEKYLSKEEAEELIKRLEGKTAKVKKVEKKIKKEPPPLLFNLAELQSEANKRFKISVNKTLEIAQDLYEKKLISYPRTDSRVLSTEVLPELPKILNGLYKNVAYKESVAKIKTFGPFAVNKNNKRFVDDGKVQDHYAIIPTYVTKDLSLLEEKEKKIYDLIVKRFLAAFYPPAEYNTVKVETDVDGETFVTNSKALKAIGWKEVYDMSEKKEEDLSDSPIQNLIKGEPCRIDGFHTEQKETKPPPRYTDGTLIVAMEKAGRYIEDEELREQIKTCGIGTSATRAGIIQKLADNKHIKIQPRTRIVTPTPKGEEIVNIVARTAKELLNPILTASWEKGLFMIENKEITPDVFEEKLKRYIEKTIAKVKATDY